MAEIEAEASARSFPVIFLGDSLTQLWDREAWQRYFTGFPALNAGVGGDRTDHLLWRLDNGMLHHLRPKLIVLLIGTNDLTLGRPPALVAEGIRTILLQLQKRWPQASILLEGLWPRDDRPDRRQQAEEVNALIARCAGGAVTYADFSKALLDPSGQLLAAAYQTDKLHLGRSGYEKISPPIAEKIQQLLGHSSGPKQPAASRPLELHNVFNVCRLYLRADYGKAGTTARTEPREILGNPCLIGAVPVL